MEKKKMDGADPVKNFEKWKKKYGRTKARVKRERAREKKPEWQVEREYIERLVARYGDIDAERAVRFSDFPISKKTLLGLQEARYRQPTEVQRRTVRAALLGKDVLGAAKTGSGKTLAFLIPVLECLYRQQWTSVDGLGALIVSPTRELAYQTFQVLRRVGRNHEFSAGLIIGGKDLKTESEGIHRTNIVVCTPGRLLQHMDETAGFRASDLQLLVLDEADRVLDLGFAETLNAIVENLPGTRQTLLFSATQTKSVQDLARLSLRDPEYVWVHEKARFSTPASLDQNYVVCELHRKVDVLFSFIRSHLKKKVIVFFACCKEVQYLFRALCRLRPGTPVLALHGKQQQMKRVEVYDDFIRKRSAVLLATDIAARGLDFPAVNWVLQFDCPEDADTYIHRVGRAARYKEGGEALLLLLPSEEAAMVAQLRDKKVPIDKIQVNADKLQSVQQKLEAFLAQEKELKERAQRCFVSYLRSVYLMKNKEVFDVFKLQIQEYALSLGLAVAPRVRFLNKAQAQRAQSDGQGEEEEELKSFKAQLRGNAPREGSPSSESEDSADDEETEPEAGQSRTLLLGAEDDDEDDDDLRDLDLLTVKRKDVFSLTGGDDESSDEPDTMYKKKTEKETKFKEAKKVLKRNFQVNTKVTFSEDGEAVQLWPQVQRAVTAEEEEGGEEEISGIDVEKAKERMKREDQEDKLEYRRKVQAKHREQRLKAKAARREASKQHARESDEEDEVMAYLANHSEDEFDPSALPDPDKLRPDEDEDEDEEEDEDQTRSAKRQLSSESSDEEEEELTAGKRKKVQQQDEEHTALDTGLSLAEDEELVLHLLGGRS